MKIRVQILKVFFFFMCQFFIVAPWVQARNFHGNNDRERNAFFYAPTWKTGYWYHGYYANHLGWWWIVGPDWYLYANPYYPYPPEGTMPLNTVKVDGALKPPAAPAPQMMSGNKAEKDSAYAYYCEKLKNYYPSIQDCPEGWVAVPVSGPPRFNHEEEVKPETRTIGIHQKDAVSLEIFGRALVYSLNYDRAVSDHVTLGLGLSSWSTSDHWQNYQANIFVLPLYANYYLSQERSRGFFSLGADYIHASQNGPDGTTFEVSGVAAVMGGGYEFLSQNGFLVRLSGFLIVGRSTTINPSVGLGFSF